jgi:hypothetical protein
LTIYNHPVFGCRFARNGSGEDGIKCSVLDVELNLGPGMMAAFLSVCGESGATGDVGRDDFFRGVDGHDTRDGDCGLNSVTSADVDACGEDGLIDTGGGGGDATLSFTFGVV